MKYVSILSKTLAKVAHATPVRATRPNNGAASNAKVARAAKPTTVKPQFWRIGSGYLGGYVSSRIIKNTTGAAKPPLDKISSKASNRGIS